MSIIFWIVISTLILLLLIICAVVAYYLINAIICDNIRIANIIKAQKRFGKRYIEYDESFDNGDALKASTTQLAHEIEYLQGIRCEYEDILDTIGALSA